MKTPRGGGGGQWASGAEPGAPQRPGSARAARSRSKWAYGFAERNGARGRNGARAGGMRAERAPGQLGAEAGGAPLPSGSKISPSSTAGAGDGGTGEGDIESAGAGSSDGGKETREEHL